MRAHFIAIGGSAMHNLALALHAKGCTVSGSDDEIFDPAKSRLQMAGLLPKEIGWFPEKITKGIDEIILGMHARADNPELLRAKELGLKIYSYPEYLYEQTKGKARVVVGGSHGKTSTTAMIMHVLRHVGIEFDYMVGAQLDGFDTMVRLSNTSQVAVFEGDEYLTSPIDPRPKFHLYKPHVGIITGIAWDHINVFPTWDIYVEQFAKFVNLIEDGGALIYCSADKTAASVAEVAKDSIAKIGYDAHPYINNNGICSLVTPKGNVPLKIFGEHNLQNLSAAMLACERAGVSREQFYHAISTFAGAARRLQLMARAKDCNVYYDFAHSPSKLKATVDAVKKQFPNRRLYACMELHTFSSLTREFLEQYHGSMAVADVAFVYFNPETIKHKQLAAISAEEVLQVFGGDVRVLTSNEELATELKKLDNHSANFLLMSSGSFGGFNIKSLSEELVKQ
ncbi:MAG: Mur ligase domain-containing protein [Prevotellaceae bacterium]|jgi:UDP-N-acetylmuramate: L-alanyl-gamma-D-glutamyl-meso-diaminopimelate ligase|nr:Mur ligase domain-containing protein [Prevotellaceae bacterium]